MVSSTALVPKLSLESNHISYPGAAPFLFPGPGSAQPVDCETGLSPAQRKYFISDWSLSACCLFSSLFELTLCLSVSRAFPFSQGIFLCMRPRQSLPEWTRTTLLPPLGVSHLSVLWRIPECVCHVPFSFPSSCPSIPSLLAQTQVLTLFLFQCLLSAGLICVSDFTPLRTFTG